MEEDKVYIEYEEEEEFISPPTDDAQSLTDEQRRKIKEREILDFLTDYDPFKNISYGKTTDEQRKYTKFLTSSFHAGMSCAEKIDLSKIPEIDVDDINISAFEALYPPGSFKVYDPHTFYKGFISKLIETQAKQKLVNDFNLDDYLKGDKEND